MAAGKARRLILVCACPPTAITFERLAYVDRLKEAGFNDKQARAQADALDAASSDSVAMKADMRESERRLEAKKSKPRRHLRAGIARWLFAAVIAIGGLILAAVEFVKRDDVVSCATAEAARLDVVTSPRRSEPPAQVGRAIVGPSSVAGSESALAGGSRANRCARHLSSSAGIRPLRRRFRDARPFWRLCDARHRRRQQLILLHRRLHPLRAEQCVKSRKDEQCE